MNERDIIDMARQAGAMLYNSPANPNELIDIMFTPEGLACFADLIRADERERIKAANAPEIERINAHLKSLKDAVKAEREACLACYSPDDTATDWADKIRARGNT